MNVRKKTGRPPNNPTKPIENLGQTIAELRMENFKLQIQNEALEKILDRILARLGVK